MRSRKVLVGLTALTLLVAACSSSGATTAPSTAASAAAPSTAPSAATSEAPPAASASTGTGGTVGEGEGELNLVAWTQYVIGGTGGEPVPDGGYDWVTPFETATGCKTTVKVGASSSEMVQLMKTGQYDGVSASGDATLRLIAGGDVAAVDTSKIPNYANVFEGLKNQPHNTVNGVTYGVPHGRGANLLLFNTTVVPETTDSWNVVFDGGSAYKGKVTAYDYEIYIADAAVYLMSTKPELGITNPYALDDAQFTAAVELLKAQRQNITTYWGTAQQQIDGFTNGDMVVGTTWQYQAGVLEAAKQPVKAIKPKEGATGWSDTWMISAQAKHPNCMYKWMDWIISPTANAQATVWFGEAPVSPQACAEAEKLSPGHCDLFHATDEAYFKDVYYWNTPTAECLDGRGAICKDFSEWTKAWTEIKG
jgi:putative spermidine/putrescine transport system substrate-binding protein